MKAKSKSIRVKMPVGHIKLRMTYAATIKKLDAEKQRIAYNWIGGIQQLAKLHNALLDQSKNCAPGNVIAVTESAKLMEYAFDLRLSEMNKWLSKEIPAPRRRRVIRRKKNAKSKRTKSSKK